MPIPNPIGINFRNFLYNAAVRVILRSLSAQARVITLHFATSTPGVIIRIIRTIDEEAPAPIAIDRCFSQPARPCGNCERSEVTLVPFAPSRLYDGFARYHNCGTPW